MAFLLSTTGTQDPVILFDLGERTFTHPTTNVDLELEFFLYELLSSTDLYNALSSGWITLTFDNANVTVDTFHTLSRGNMQTFTYDVDLNGIVDTASTSGNALKLNGSAPSFYLDRANHTGTQTASSISDFNSAVAAVVTATSGTAGYAGFASTAGWATNAAHSYLSDNATLLNNQNAAFYLSRANHTGTQVAATISDFYTAQLSGTSGYAFNAANAFQANNASLLNNNNAAFYLSRTNHTGTQTASTISDFYTAQLSGTSGYAFNAANAFTLNNQSASFYLNTNSSINALIDVDTVTVPPVYQDVLNYSTSGTGNWVPVHVKQLNVRNSWVLTAGVSATNATNRYCDYWGGTMNLSPYIVPFNATLIYISAATNGNKTWTAEIRRNGATLASLAITAASSGRSALLNVNVNAGDAITLFINGTSINRPTISAHFIER